MSYTAQTWHDGVSGATPISAARLTHMEQGILDASTRLGRLCFSVKNYGATGDGVTNDLAAIQATIDAATVAGGTVLFPTGTYTVAASITPKSNVTLRGVGATSVLKTSVNGHVIASAAAAFTDFSIEDLTFVGPVNNTVSVPTRGRTTSGPGADVAVWIDGSLDTTGSFPLITNFTMRNCQVRNTTWLPIRIFGVSGRVEVTGNEFTNCMDAGFGFNAEVICASNHSLMSADNGFSISRGNLKVTCTGNTVENAAYYGIWLSGFTGSPGPNLFACTGNTIKNVGQAGIVLMDAPKWGAIVGNTIDKGFYRGAAGSPDDTSCCGIYVRGDSTSVGSPSTLSTGLLIADNKIRQAAKAGIYLTGVTAVKVSNNLITDTGTQYWADGTTPIVSNYTSQNIGILIDTPATSSAITITGNMVVDTRVTPYTNYGVQPLSAAGVSSWGNSMFGCRNASNLPSFVRSDTLGSLASGQETMPRWAATNASNITMSSGVIRFGYFTACRNELVSKISLSSGSIAAGATPTLIRFGLYSVDSSGNLTQLAATTSDTAIFAGALTPYSRSLSSSVTLIEGQLYCIAAIVVTAAAAPTTIGVLSATGLDNAVAPRLSGVLTAQTDLGASYTAGQVAVTQSFLYAAATP